MIFRIAIGALAMYYLDPISGKRRRALLRDKAIHAKQRLSDYSGLQRRAERRKLDIDLTQDLGR